MDFLDHLGQAAQARILVIGDVMLDRYVEGSVERISPEAPVPVLRHRILPNFKAEAEGVDADQVITKLVETVPVP